MCTRAGNEDVLNFAYMFVRNVYVASKVVMFKKLVQGFSREIGETWSLQWPCAWILPPRVVACQHLTMI